MLSVYARMDICWLTKFPIPFSFSEVRIIASFDSLIEFFTLNLFFLDVLDEVCHLYRRLCGCKPFVSLLHSSPLDRLL